LLGFIPRLKDVGFHHHLPVNIRFIAVVVSNGFKRISQILFAAVEYSQIVAYMHRSCLLKVEYLFDRIDYILAGTFHHFL
jgi:hypothetical protein